MNTTPNGQIPGSEQPKKRRAARRIPSEQAGTAPQMQERPSQAPVIQPQSRPMQAPAAQAQSRPTQAPAAQAQSRPTENPANMQTRVIPTRGQQNQARPAQTQPQHPAQSRPAQNQGTPRPVQPQSAAGQRQASTQGQTPVPTERRQAPIPTNGREQKPAPRGIEYVNVKRPGNASSADAAAKTEKPAETAPKSTSAKPKKKKVKVRYVGGSALGSLLKAIVYIMSVLVISGFLSYYIIVIANDVFAFVKPTEEIAVQIENNATIDDIAEELYAEGVIEYPKIFSLYTRIRRDLEEVEFVAGEHMVSTSMNYDYLYKTFLPKSVRAIERITIPEGYTVDEIIDLFVSYGMGTRAGFADAIQNADFSDYWFIAELDGSMDPARRYRLEGYLFPDTYEFYTDWTETQILRKLLDNFATKFDIAYKERCDELGLSVDEVIILASMIQMEAKYAEEYGAISSVFHNRLKSSAFMKRLDSDATIQYALGTDRKSELTHEDTELDSPYNTYTNPGLPPGPISNPSLNAISYALYPDKTEYYYFVAKPNGYSLFATTEPEHLENIRIARGQ